MNIYINLNRGSEVCDIILNTLIINIHYSDNRCTVQVCCCCVHCNSETKLNELTSIKVDLTEAVSRYFGRTPFMAVKFTI